MPSEIKIMITVENKSYYKVYIPSMKKKKLPYNWKFRSMYISQSSHRSGFSWMAYNEASFQLEIMPSSEFPRTKFSLLIDHPQTFPAIRYV